MKNPFIGPITINGQRAPLAPDYDRATTPDEIAALNSRAQHLNLWHALSPLDRSLAPLRELPHPGDAHFVLQAASYWYGHDLGIEYNRSFSAALDHARSQQIEGAEVILGLARRYFLEHLQNNLRSALSEFDWHDPYWLTLRMPDALAQESAERRTASTPGWETR